MKFIYIIKINGTKMCLKLKSYIVTAKSHNFMSDQIFPSFLQHKAWAFQMFSIFSSFLLKQASTLPNLIQ